MAGHSIKKSLHRTLGVFADSSSVYAFYNLPKEEGGFFRIESSKNGVNFSLFHPICQILDEKGQRVDARKTTDFHIAQVNEDYFVLAYKNGEKLSLARTGNFAQFENICDIGGISEEGCIVSNFQYHGQHVMYWGENSINVAFSHNLVNWKLNIKPVLASKEDYFGPSPLKIAGAFEIEEGLLVLYYDCKKIDDVERFFLHGVIFDKNDPTNIIKDVTNPLWEPLDVFAGKKLIPAGVVMFRGELISYWQTDGEIIALVHPFVIDKILERKTTPTNLLKRLKHNPIIKPIVENKWESKATFNPAAIHDRDKVHIIYRAIGDDDVSVLGYATSFDGFNIDARSNKPIYVPTKHFEGVSRDRKTEPYGGLYTSGGGVWGGCEDPRITKLDNKFFMTYVAYDGANPPRVAMTSIDEEDFHKQNWKWKEPVLISPPGIVDKNACVMSEKINGKYVIFHRIYPNILVDFVEDLNFDGETNFLKGEFTIKPRVGFWDSRKIGAGAPPVKTDDGWLLIYQAVGDDDSGRYKIGAMMLDAKDPTKVLYRSKQPILEPIDRHENEGHKAGVAYPCGAVTVGDKLIIYYGGADTVVCAAWANTNKFLKNMKTFGNSPFFETNLTN